MIDQGFRDVRSRVAELKRRLAAAVYDEQRLYQRYSEERREADRWRQRAELALSKGAEELARGALARANRHESRAALVNQQYLEQKSYVERMKGQLLELETRARALPLSAPSAAELARLERNLASLERWEERAAQRQRELLAWAELERDELEEKLAALEREHRLEQQLAELKRRLQGR